MTRKIILFCLLILIIIFVFFTIQVRDVKNETYTQTAQYDALSIEYDALRNEYDALRDEHDTLNTKHDDLIAEHNRLIAEYNATGEELTIANTTIADLKSDEYELVYMGDYKLTHYCNEARQHICGYGKRTTATGTTAEVGRTVAVDPKVIPYGTQMYIEGYGWRIAEDCGGSVKNNHIDILVDYHDEALKLGVKHGGVWILVHKNPLS